MKTKIYLDKYDIQKIVAKHFNVDSKQVDVHLFTTIEGYGMDEHTAADIEVILTTEHEKIN